MINQQQEDLINFVQHPETGLKIAVIGGGTGLSTLLRGLKLYTNHLSAIVAVTDNGGSSGMLREDLGMLPPGDIRNCMVALAEAEPLLSELFKFRFQDGRLKNQNFGNLYLAAMTQVCGSFYDAIMSTAKVLAITGKVLPVSLQNLNLQAILDNGDVINGESEIGKRKNAKLHQIKKIKLEPEKGKALPEAVQDILDANIIVIGPGSLYTSLIPNLLFQEITEAITASKALKIYSCNLMTQESETYNYSAEDHINSILLHANKTTAKNYIDYCIVNNRAIEPKQLKRYAEKNSVPVGYDKNVIETMGIKVIEVPLLSLTGDIIRHDHMMLAKTIIETYLGV